MRIAFWNMNGNVGKSTLVNMMMKPRLPKNAEVIYVESDNTVPGKIAGCKELNATKEDWAELVNHLITNIFDHDIVVDIGSTDSKKVKALFVDFEGSLDEFDMIIVPHSPEAKEEDTAITLRFLHGLGVPANKITLMFSMVPSDTKLAKTFSALFADLEKEPVDNKPRICNIAIDAVISDNALFKRIKGSEHTIESLLADETNWNDEIQKLREIKDKQKAQELMTYFAWMKITTMLAKKMNADFDSVFKILMPSSYHKWDTKNV